jgi:hypothetical protein
MLCLCINNSPNNIKTDLCIQQPRAGHLPAWSSFPLKPMNPVPIFCSLHTRFCPAPTELLCLDSIGRPQTMQKSDPVLSAARNFFCQVPKRPPTMAPGHTVLSSPSTPPEIVIRILQSCEHLAQLRNLVRVSRRVNSVWHVNAPPIIWHVAPKAIPHFDLALVAVCPSIPTIHSGSH